MPLLGWRLLADALASIQIGLLSDDPAAHGALAQEEATRQLFAALRQALPAAQYQATCSPYSGQGGAGLGAGPAHRTG
jgi:hypothetical protein